MSQTKPLDDTSTGPGLVVPLDRRDRKFIIAAVLCVSVLGSLEMTITSTIMPTIIGELNGVEHYSWVASMYLLAMSVSMPLYGRLADAIGRKKVLLFAITVFMIGSVLAAMSQNIFQLIGCRVLQGLGGGGILPIANTVLGDICTMEERAKIQSLFSTIWGSSALAGPLIGAFLVKTLGWRSAFYLNLPLGVLPLLVLLWKYHDHEKPHHTDLDLPGMISLTVATSTLLLLVSGVAPERWIYNVVLLVACLGAGTFLIRHERRTEHPMFPPEFLTHRHVGPSLYAGALLGVATLSIETYVPLYVQGARGGGAEAAAGVVTPVMLMWAVSAFFSGYMLLRWSYRRVAMIGAIFVTFGLAGLVICARTNAPSAVLTAVLALTGCGFGPAAMSFMLCAQNAVTWHRRGMVTSSVLFFRTVGGSIGLGLLGTILTRLIQPHLRELQAIGVKAGDLLNAHPTKPLPPAAVALGHKVIEQGSVWIFVGMLAFAVLQIAVSAFLPGGKTDHAVTPSEAMEAIGA